MVTGINHMTLSVRDIKESVDFYTKVLGFMPRALWSKGAYLQAGNAWVALVTDKKLRKSKLPEYTHLAFGVSSKDFGILTKRIRESGAEIWHQNTSEGASFYFLDPNGHKLEIHTGDIQTRLAWAKANPWEGLEIFD